MLSSSRHPSDGPSDRRIDSALTQELLLGSISEVHVFLKGQEKNCSFGGVVEDDVLQG